MTFWKYNGVDDNIMVWTTILHHILQSNYTEFIRNVEMSHAKTVTN